MMWPVWEAAMDGRTPYYPGLTGDALHRYASTFYRDAIPILNEWVRQIEQILVQFGCRIETTYHFEASELYLYGWQHGMRAERAGMASEQLWSWYGPTQWTPAEAAELMLRLMMPVQSYTYWQTEASSTTPSAPAYTTASGTQHYQARQIRRQRRWVPLLPARAVHEALEALFR